MAKDPLRTYRQKRDFEATGEPRGSHQGDGNRRFVIQKHDASSLHYDFRLEIEGVLVSWAVPKGPSLDPSDKHLAIRTEDHPVEYADFEGTIPEGQYGAGTVMVWDHGTYENLHDPKDGKERKAMKACLEEGLVEIRLAGKKLHGGFALKRIRDGDKPQWLLIKKRDDEANSGDTGLAETNSVKTGRSMEEIRQSAKG